jgi:hypothetical protein
MTTTDNTVQAQVDAQLLEQGAFSALELLIGSGRLIYSDYESWRRRDVELLEDLLMGSRDKIRAQIEQAVRYARSIGLVEQPQEFHAWSSQPSGDSGRPLRISGDRELHQLIASRYVPARNLPQMDLFFDNPVVALTNGIVRALSSSNGNEARRQLDQLYALAPNHADLAAFDQLLSALDHLQHEIADPQRELEFLRQITPTAKRLLGSQWRDLLSPLWRQLADALKEQLFSPADPDFHSSSALSQAQDWHGLSESVQLCLRLAQSAFYRQQRTEALTAWFHLCWRNPAVAEATLDGGQQPDSGITALWERFLDSDEDVPPRQLAETAALTCAEFPAWLLLHEPGLAQQMSEGLPTGDTAAEESYRRVHRWIQARRSSQRDTELQLRKSLQASSPALFLCLKRLVG